MVAMLTPEQTPNQDLFNFDGAARSGGHADVRVIASGTQAPSTGEYVPLDVPATLQADHDTAVTYLNQRQTENDKFASEIVRGRQRSLEKAYGEAPDVTSLPHPPASPPGEWQSRYDPVAQKMERSATASQEVVKQSRRSKLATRIGDFATRFRRNGSNNEAASSAPAETTEAVPVATIEPAKPEVISIAAATKTHGRSSTPRPRTQAAFADRSKQPWMN